MYSDLRSKLKQFAMKQDIKETVKTENNSEIDKLMNGTIETGSMGSFFMHKNTYTLDYVHGSCILGDFATLNFDYLLRMFNSNNHKLELEDMLFFDTETTGLGGSGTVAFLIGMGYFENEKFVVKQLFMRDYDEEPAMLYYLENELAKRKGLITFNGKAFDWNLLISRFIFNRIKCRQSSPMHLDLLHISRAIWKRNLESCRLISLEENLLGFKRTDDIPGYLIPPAYFKYLDDRDASDMKRVLEHNRLDIISMVSLFVKISKILNNPLEEASDYNEVFGAARIYNRAMDYGKAESCFKHCSVSNNNIIRVEALKELTGLYKNHKDYDSITKCLELIINTSKTPNIPMMIELAKHYEHRVKDINNAKSITEKAYKICLDNSMLRNIYYKDLRHRLERLLRKAAKTAKM
jgi:uncharacterized protein YprB with RNaseH-like and TPR domain